MRTIPGVGEIITLASALRAMGAPERTARRIASKPSGDLPPNFLLGTRRYVVKAVFDEWRLDRLALAGVKRLH